MQALVYTAHGAMEVRDEPRPRVHGDEVLIRVAHAGICGSELEGFASRSPRRVPPLVMGHEFSGTIEDVGPDVITLKAGDPVVVNPLIVCGRCDMCLRGASDVCRNRTLIGMGRPGGFAELVTAPERAVFKLPPAVSLSQAAMVEPLANAVHAVRIANVSVPGARVMVMGTGTIGLVCLQMAVVAGASAVVAVDVDDARLKVAEALGATRVLNPRTGNPALVRQEVTGTDGFDLVLDAVGRDETRRAGLEALGPLGTAVWIGTGQDSMTLSGNEVVHQERRIQGSYAYTDSDFRRALALIVGGRVEVGSWTQQFPLSQGADVFLGLLSGKRPGLIKAQLQPA